MACRSVDQPFLEYSTPESTPTVTEDQGIIKSTTTERSINLLHLNIRSVRNKANELEALLQEKDVDVLCLTEHWLTDDEAAVFNIDRYELISCFARKQSRGGGSAIFCKPPMNCINDRFSVDLSIESCIEISSIVLKDFNLWLVAVYRPPSADLDRFIEVLDGVIDKIGVDKMIIIVGDFNVHFNTNDRDCARLCDAMGCSGFQPMIEGVTRRNACLDNVF